MKTNSLAFQWNGSWNLNFFKDNPGLAKAVKASRLNSLAPDGGRPRRLHRTSWWCRRLLQNEFGIEPEAATTALYQCIRSAAPDARVSVGRPEEAISYLTNVPTPSTQLIGRDREITNPLRTPEG